MSGMPSESIFIHIFSGSTNTTTTDVSRPAKHIDMETMLPRFWCFSVGYLTFIKLYLQKCEIIIKKNRLQCGSSAKSNQKSKFVCNHEKAQHGMQRKKTLAEQKKIIISLFLVKIDSIPQWPIELVDDVGMNKRTKRHQLDFRLEIKILRFLYIGKMI